MQNVNKVLYTQDQSGVFSTEQKAVARNNIGAQAQLTTGPNIDIFNDIISTEKHRVEAGTNVSVTSSLDNVNRVVTYTVSSSDTKYSAGSGLDLNGTEFSVDMTTVQPKLTAGDNVQINNNVISATDTTYTAGENIRISSNHEISSTTVFRTWTFHERTATLTADDIANGYVDFLYVLGTEGVAVCEYANIIAMKGYDIQSSNQFNGRTLSFLLVPHGGGVSVLIDSGFPLYTESVVSNYPWQAFKAIGLTMGANLGKYDAVLRVSLNGTESVGNVISMPGRVAVTLVGLVN